MASWLLVHSPLLGPYSWQAVADLLDARVPDLRPTLALPSGFAAAQADIVSDAAPAGTSVWLAGHSRAGTLLGLVADTLARRGVRVEATVFVDARLPIPGVSRRGTLEDDLRAQLDAMAVDGWLPPWPRWWPEDAVAELVPDGAIRAALYDDCRAIPMALYDEPMPDAPDAPEPRYLQLSDAYADEAAEAEGRGWPVLRMPADHLALLTQPAEIAAAMQALAAQPDR